MIRRAGPDDAAAIAALFRRSFGTLRFLPTLHTPEEDRAFFRRAAVEHEVWVFEEDGRILGFAALSPDMLEHLYVEPEANGRGIGTALLSCVKERRPEGFTFWVFQRNDRARRFYERHGCRVVRLTDGAGNEENEPDALYEWRPVRP
jgi:ribosomal protein S18 acetylase RimI-like enzyme